MADEVSDFIPTPPGTAVSMIAVPLAQEDGADLTLECNICGPISIVTATDTETEAFAHLDRHGATEDQCEK